MPWHIMINSKSKHVDLLLKVYKELVKAEYDVRMHEKDLTPPVLKQTITMDNAYFKTLPYAQAMLGSVNKTVAPVYFIIPEWTALSEIIGDAVSAVIEGKDVKSTLDTAAQKMQTILDER